MSVFHVMRMLFGGHVDGYDYHVVGPNEEFLGYFLNASGYVNIQKVQGFGLFDDASSLVFKGGGGQLEYIVAEKPWRAASGAQMKESGRGAETRR